MASAPIPFVSFTPESASALECVGWATKSLLAGDILGLVKEDVPAAWRALARMVDGATSYFSGGPMMASSDAPEWSVAMSELAAAAGVQVPVEGAFPWQLVLQTAVKLLMEMLANREA